MSAWRQSPGTIRACVDTRVVFFHSFPETATGTRILFTFRNYPYAGIVAILARLARSFEHKEDIARNQKLSPHASTNESDV